MVRNNDDSAKQAGSGELAKTRKAGLRAPIPARSPHIPVGLVDLTAHYNTALDDDVHDKPGNNLAAVPKGIQRLAYTLFDIRGLIQLAGCRSAEITHVLYPESVTSIAVHARGRQVHFLQGAAWNAEEGTRIGEYCIHYADGRMEIAPIIYLKNVVDWWVRPGDKPPTEAQVAWSGNNPRTQGLKFSILLCKYTWANPRSDAEIATVNFVSAIVDSAPFLLAITVE